MAPPRRRRPVPRPSCRVSRAATRGRIKLRDRAALTTATVSANRRSTARLPTPTSQKGTSSTSSPRSAPRRVTRRRRVALPRPTAALGRLTAVAGRRRSPSRRRRTLTADLTPYIARTRRHAQTASRTLSRFGQTVLRWRHQADGTRRRRGVPGR
ncbi:hypothetical protein NP493_2762g00004 [Ridgeia piscesae]|uniref:Uncharacterized protein n=1 Tax=Ridgeia piscesae TaxID=27915 RepID=A0AAD9N187_RIDPI|nr:hypothetical protein NP493_2762g00004 [Ridgeia piscesae]